MQRLEEQLQQKIAWVGAQHDDHTPNRHVHVIAVLRKRLHVRELKPLRQSATTAALLQRQQRDLDQTRDYRRAWRVRSPSLKQPSPNRSLAGARAAGRSAPLRPAPNTHNPFNRHLCTCPYCLTEHDKRLEAKSHRCYNCRRLLHEEPKPALTREKSRKEAEWER